MIRSMTFLSTLAITLVVSACGNDKDDNRRKGNPFPPGPAIQDPQALLGTWQADPLKGLQNRQTQLFLRFGPKALTVFNVCQQGALTSTAHASSEIATNQGQFEVKAAAIGKNAPSEAGTVACDVDLAAGMRGFRIRGNQLQVTYNGDEGIYQRLTDDAIIQSLDKAME